MISPWRSELSFIVLALLVGAFAGKLFHHPALILWFGLLIYLARHLLYANRLLGWLRAGVSADRWTAAACSVRCAFTTDTGTSTARSIKGSQDCWPP